MAVRASLIRAVPRWRVSHSPQRHHAPRAPLSGPRPGFCLLSLLGTYVAFVVLRRPQRPRSERCATGCATAKGWMRDRSRLSATAKLSTGDTRSAPGCMYLRRFCVGVWQRCPSGAQPAGAAGSRAAPLLWAGPLSRPSARSRVSETPSLSLRTRCPTREGHELPRGGYATAVGGYATAMGWIRDRVTGHLRYVG